MTIAIKQPGQFTQRVREQVSKWTRLKTTNEIYKKIDFSYLQDALVNTYDIESTLELFTLAMINDRRMSLILFGDEQFDDVTDKELHRQIRNFINKPDTLRYMKKDSPDEIESTVYRFEQGNAEHMKQFEKILLRMITCKALEVDIPYTNEAKFAEYHGWNSSRYDLPLMILIYLATKTLKENMTPKYIRFLSNTLIRYDGSQYEFPNHIELMTKGVIKASMYRYWYNLALWSDGHVDWAKIAKSDKQEDDTDSLLPPALKKEMARDGMDIIIDESVASNDPKIWTQEDKEELVDYNFNDVLGTRVKSFDPYLHTRLYTRDMIRKMYPYTAARYTDMSKLTRYTPSERDATAANLAGLVLIGPNRIKSVDYDGISFAFPVPDKSRPGEMQWVDLWEYMKETEEFIPTQLDDFFTHFRDKDTRAWKDLSFVLKTQPITASSTVNIPYYRDGNPTDTCATVSTGGAHGNIVEGLHLKCPAQIDAWIRAGGPQTAVQKPTIDAKDVIHIDWSSFYPTMASKMRMYLTSEGYDRYTSIIEHRIKIKQSIPYDKNDWTEVDYENADKQEGFKFVLNNATGAANTHKKYALLPLDNKTLSMRLIGNMFIWALAQRLTQAGAFVIATNTDGLYVCNIEMEKCEKIIEEYIADYGMGVEPEPLTRFVNRDTSNRIEFVNGHRQKVGGRLRHGHGLFFGSMSLGQNIAYPLIAANAVLEYISNDEEWLSKPYDRQRIVDYMKKIQSENHPTAWYHVYVGSAKRTLIYDDVDQQRINRVVLTKEGRPFAVKTLKAMTQEFTFKFIQQLYQGVQPRDMVIDDEKLSYKGRLQTEDFVPSDFALVTTLKERSETRYLKTAPIYNFDSLEEFKNYAKVHGTAKLGVYNPNTEEYDLVEKWTRSETVSGYPLDINRGEVLNTAKELRDFDKSKLNIDAYVRWAENLLKNWKVTCDIPDLGLVHHDDTVIPTVRAVRVTKLDRELEKIHDLYKNLMSLGGSEE